MKVWILIAFFSVGNRDATTITIENLISAQECQRVGAMLMRNPYENFRCVEVWKQ